MSLSYPTMGNAQGHGGMAPFNADFGSEEALLRGFRSGFISNQQYAALMDYKEPKPGDNM